MHVQLCSTSSLVPRLYCPAFFERSKISGAKKKSWAGELAWERGYSTPTKLNLNMQESRNTRFWRSENANVGDYAPTSRSWLQNEVNGSLPIRMKQTPFNVRERESVKSNRRYCN